MNKCESSDGGSASRFIKGYNGHSDPLFVVIKPPGCHACFSISRGNIGKHIGTADASNVMPTATEGLAGKNSPSTDVITSLDTTRAKNPPENILVVVRFNHNPNRAVRVRLTYW